MRRLIIATLWLISALAGPAVAKVERIEILSREPFANGAAFGTAGAYEKLRGRAWFLSRWRIQVLESLSPA